MTLKEARENLDKAWNELGRARTLGTDAEAIKAKKAYDEAMEALAAAREESK